MSHLILSKNASGSGLRDNHDGGLDVTGGEVRVDAAIDNELSNEFVSSNSIKIYAIDRKNQPHLPGYQFRTPWC